MPTIFTALILVAVIIIVSWVFVAIYKRERRKKIVELLDQFRRIGIAKNLSFSSQEVLENSVIGLDGILRKLLIVRKSEDGRFNFALIDLNKVKNCSVQKFYRSINLGTSKKEEYEKQIDKIVLRIELFNGEQSDLVFFDPLQDTISRMHELEEKAAKWEGILSKLAQLKNKGKEAIFREK